VDDGPQDVAVMGLMAGLKTERNARSREGGLRSLEGVEGYDKGGPQEVAVDGVGGESSNIRPAMSGEGRRSEDDSKDAVS